MPELVNPPEDAPLAAPGVDAALQAPGLHEWTQPTWWFDEAYLLSGEINRFSRDTP